MPRPVELLAVVPKATAAWVKDRAASQAASLAYYTVFAVGPLLALTVYLAGLAAGEQATEAALRQQMRRLLGERGATALGALLDGEQGAAGPVGLAVGGAVLLVGALCVVARLREALDHVWEIEDRSPATWPARVRKSAARNLAWPGLFGLGFLLVVGLVPNAVAGALAASSALVWSGPAAPWLGHALPVAALAAFFAAMYKLVPSARVAWHDVLVGGAATAVLFTVGQALVGLYLGTAAVQTRYGSAGAVLVVLVWVYYCCATVLFGAELTQVYANLHGHEVRPDERAEPQEVAARRRGKAPEKEGRPGRRGRPARGPGRAEALASHGSTSPRAPKGRGHARRERAKAR